MSDGNLHTEYETCICCHKQPVTWPRVCDGCQDKEAQAELLAALGPEMECLSCGMIYDGGMRCTYCGCADPLGDGDGDDEDYEGD